MSDVQAALASGSRPTVAKRFKSHRLAAPTDNQQQEAGSSLDALATSAAPNLAQAHPAHGPDNFHNPSGAQQQQRQQQQRQQQQQPPGVPSVAPSTGVEHPESITLMDSDEDDVEVTDVRQTGGKGAPPVKPPQNSRTQLVWNLSPRNGQQQQAGSAPSSPQGPAPAPAAIRVLQENVNRNMRGGRELGALADQQHLGANAQVGKGRGRGRGGGGGGSGHQGVGSGHQGGGSGSRAKGPKGQNNQLEAGQQRMDLYCNHSQGGAKLFQGHLAKIAPRDTAAHAQQGGHDQEQGPGEEDGEGDEEDDEFQEQGRRRAPRKKAGGASRGGTPGGRGGKAVARGQKRASVG